MMRSLTADPSADFFSAVSMAAFGIRLARLRSDLQAQIVCRHAGVTEVNVIDALQPNTVAEGTASGLLAGNGVAEPSVSAICLRWDCVTLTAFTDSSDSGATRCSLHFK